MDARWHQVVTGTLRRRLGQDRRLDFEKAELGKGSAGPLQQPMPQDDVRLQFRPTKIQHSVLQSQFFGREFLPLTSGNRDRRGHRRADNTERGDLHLDLA